MVDPGFVCKKPGFKFDWTINTHDLYYSASTKKVTNFGEKHTSAKMLPIMTESKIYTINMELD